MNKEKSLKNWNVISISKLEELIKFQLEALWDSSQHQSWEKNHNRKISELIPPIMIWGPPGVGKSSVIRDVAKDLGVGYIDVRLAQREPIDIRGLPVPKEDGVHWHVSAEWPRDQDSKGIIIFDELTAADRTLQVAAYEFILDRRLGDLYTVPDGWYILGAGNRASDRAMATTMSSALANRFMHVEIEPDAEAWIKWALQRSIHPDVIGFLRFKPHLLFDMQGNLERGFPTPRAWERVSTMLHIAEQSGKNDVTPIAIEGLVGGGAGIEFNEYRKWSHEFQNVRKLMLNSEDGIEIPQRADQQYALCAAMVYYLWRSKDDAEQKKLLDGFFNISLKLTSDFATMAIVDAMHGKDPEKADYYSKRLIEHRLYPEWQSKHGTVLKKRLQNHDS